MLRKLNKACLVSLAALFIAAVCLTQDAAYAQKSSSTLPVQIEFDNSPGNMITSDGQGSYVDNEPQLEAVINQNSGDLLLNLYYTKRPERFLTFNLPPAPPPSGCYVMQPPAYPIPILFEAKAFMNVNNIWKMNVGEMKLTGAEFETNTPVGKLRLGSRYNAYLNSCSGQVWVQRVTSGTWNIWSAPSTLTAGAEGVACLIQNFNRTGQANYQPVEYCVQPFSLTVTLVP